jgi:hypothetical protein
LLADLQEIVRLVLISINKDYVELSEPSNLARDDDGLLHGLLGVSCQRHGRTRPSRAFDK